MARVDDVRALLAAHDEACRMWSAADTYKSRLRMECVATLTDAGHYLLAAPDDPTGPCEVASKITALHRERDAALARAQAAEERLAKACTLLGRTVRYAREDRMQTPGYTRLTRCLGGAERFLAEQPPAPEPSPAPAGDLFGDDAPLLLRVDMSLRGVLCWAGEKWGEPESVMHAVRGVVDEIARLRADVARAVEAERDACIAIAFSYADRLRADGRATDTVSFAETRASVADDIGWRIRARGNTTTEGT